MNLLKIFPFGLLWITFAITAQAQQTRDAHLTLDRLFQSDEFQSDRFGPVRWMDNGTAYTTLEPSVSHQGSYDIVKYDAESNQREILVEAEKLIPAGASRPLTVEDYEWSHQKKVLLIFTNSKRVWRYNTRGDYWVLDMQTQNLHQVGKSLPSSSLMFTKFSPDDTRLAYVSGHNIYVEDLAGDKLTAITTDGTEKLINGTFDWAYEEEFDCRDGFRWSPDGKNIAYWQIDAAEIKNFLMVNNTDSVYSFNIPVQYPKVGEDPSGCRIGIVDASGGETRWMPIPGDQKQNYLPRMIWAPDAKSIYVQQLNRKQNLNKVWKGSTTNFTVEQVYTERDDAWLDTVDDWIWFDEGREFSWLSEKDGWRHFYRVSADGQKEILVTEGDFDLANIELIDDDHGYVYFIASPDNPTQRYLYRAKLNGKGKAQRLTPEGMGGTHSYQIGAGARYAIHTYSDVSTPPVIELVSLPDHKVVRTFVTNQRLRNTLEALDRNEVKFFKVTTAEQVEMDGFMITPPDFDESKKYPVLFYVYGEPAGQTARDVWGGSRMMWHYMLAQQGYIVITMDNRGTPTLKGRAWRKAIYRKIGVINASDQALAAKEVLKWDFVDPERIGVWGWSGGGSMTLNLLFQYPAIYKTGMSVAPVANQLYYDNIYQERYMGVPWENKDDFIKGSPISYAQNLQGNLLLVHGTGDDNVHYQNSEALINALILHNKVFQVMPYPNRSHGIYEGQNTRRHLFTLLTHYLNTHVEPGGK